MAKAKTEVNPLSVERINELISDSGMAQKEFAEKVVHCTQQHMNRMARGNSPITAETAAQITKYFPKIRSEWILGIDDKKTIMDYVSANVDLACKAIDYSIFRSQNRTKYAFEEYLKCYGYRSEYFEPTMSMSDEQKLIAYLDSLEKYEDGLTETEPKEPVFEFGSYEVSARKYWILKDEKNNSFFDIPLKLYEDTIQEIADFAEFKIKKLIEGSKADG